MDTFNHMSVPVPKGGAKVRTPESELLERAEWYQAQYQKLLTALNDAEKRADMYKRDLERIRDCDFVITLPDRMDAVRAIAREALK
jgi:hypothetical protein